MVLTGLRKFHNLVKDLVLKKYTETGKFKLLDLASGKGGDIHKWIKNKNISLVKGYDISQVSVIEARNRLSKLKEKKNISFSVKDLGENVLPPTVKYSIITSFFAFHYFFKSPETLATILQSVKNTSKSGTIVLLCLFDGSKVNKLEFPYIQKDFYIERTLEGIVVGIKDSVLHTPTLEYIVTPMQLKKAFSPEFELLEETPFEEYYKQIKTPLTEQEKKLSFLNKMYVFKKI